MTPALEMVSTPSLTLTASIRVVRSYRWTSRRRRPRPIVAVLHMGGLRVRGQGVGRSVWSGQSPLVPAAARGRAVGVPSRQETRGAAPRSRAGTSQRFQRGRSAPIVRAWESRFSEGLSLCPFTRLTLYFYAQRLRVVLSTTRAPVQVAFRRLPQGASAVSSLGPPDVFGKVKHVA